MHISRRQFIKAGVAGLLGSVTLSGSAAALLANKAVPDSARRVELEDYDWEKHYWGFVCDNRRCIGCGRCVVACKEENSVPRLPEFNRTWVERYVITEEGEVFVDSPAGGIDGFTAEHMNAKYQKLRVRKTFFVPKLCNQCDNPPCVAVCPVSATYTSRDGVTLVDQKRCIGCGYCVVACPYGARYLVPAGDRTPTGEVGVADKCTWCYHRITKGLQPACVEACPVKARIFGDLREPTSPVSQILREARAYVLKPALGTKPKVYYLGLEREIT